MTLMLQNFSGTNLCTLKYLSTTKPKVGNWHDPTATKVRAKHKDFVTNFFITVADHFVCQISSEGLKVERLVPRERRTKSQIKLDPGADRMNLTIIQVNRILSGTDDVTSIDQKMLLWQKRRGGSHALSVLLNLARFTWSL